MFIYWLKAWELPVCISCRISTFILSSTAARHHGYALDLPSLCSKEGAENLWLTFVGFEACGRDSVADASECPSGSVSKGGGTRRWGCFSMFPKNIITGKLNNLQHKCNKTLPGGTEPFILGVLSAQNTRKFKAVLWATESFIWRVWNPSEDFPGNACALKQARVLCKWNAGALTLPFPEVCEEGKAAQEAFCFNTGTSLLPGNMLDGLLDSSKRRRKLFGFSLQESQEHSRPGTPELCSWTSTTDAAPHFIYQTMQGLSSLDMCGFGAGTLAATSKEPD